MLTRYVVSLVIVLAGLIGVVEATAQCPAGQVPVLNRSLGGNPFWDGCVPSRSS